MSDEDILKGFEIVASDSVPSITLDNQQRFYLNTSARRLMDVAPYKKVSLAYNSEIKAIAIIRPDTGMSPQEISEMMTSVYSIDKRYYMSARHFAKTYAYPPEGAPYNFVYERGASNGSVFIFRLHK